MRILLIEDDAATAQSIELMLKSENFNVYVTDLGEEGIDLGKLYDYDIILLDLNLPDMSGYEVLRALRRHQDQDADSDPLRHGGHRGQGAAASASAPTTISPSRSTRTSWWRASTPSSAARRATPNR